LCFTFLGDHKQLKPSTAVYKLSKDFNIDVSLFERMINNKMDCPILNVQHRMRPEISSLITPLIYPDLLNDQSVFTFEDIRGMTKNLFFLEHDNYEQNVSKFHNIVRGQQGYSTKQQTKYFGRLKNENRRF